MRKSIYLIFGVIGLLIVITLAWYFVSREGVSNDNEDTQNIAPMETIVDFSDPYTIDYLEYEDLQDSLVFSYPENWEVSTFEIEDYFNENLVQKYNIKSYAEVVGQVEDFSPEIKVFKGKSNSFDQVKLFLQDWIELYKTKESNVVIQKSDEQDNLLYMKISFNNTAGDLWVEDVKIVFDDQKSIFYAIVFGYAGEFNDSFEATSFYLISSLMVEGVNSYYTWPDIQNPESEDE